MLPNARSQYNNSNYNLYQGKFGVANLKKKKNRKVKQISTDGN